MDEFLPSRTQTGCRKKRLAAKHVHAATWDAAKLKLTLMLSAFKSKQCCGLSLTAATTGATVTAQPFPRWECAWSGLLRLTREAVSVG